MPTLRFPLFLWRFALTSPRAVRLSLIARQLAGQLPAQQATSGSLTEEKSDLTVSDLTTNGLLDEHLDAVYRYALRLTRNAEQASDLTQDTMLRAWRKRVALRETDKTKVWLLRIANNLWTDQIRRDIRRPRLLLEQPPPSREPTVTKKMIEQENVAQALAALDQLPDRQRQVMHLIIVEQLGQQTTAEILGISLAAVKASLSMARKQMREQLRDLYREVCGAKRCPTND